MTTNQKTFAAALKHHEFSHVERFTQDGTAVLFAYRHDPASSAGKGYLASHLADAWAHYAVTMAAIDRMLCTSIPTAAERAARLELGREWGAK